MFEVDQNLVISLLKLWELYKLENPPSLYGTQSFEGFMYWLNHKSILAPTPNSKANKGEK